MPQQRFAAGACRVQLAERASPSMVFFGGLNFERDLNDLYCLTPAKPIATLKQQALLGGQPSCGEVSYSDAPMPPRQVDGLRH